VSQPAPYGGGIGAAAGRSRSNLGWSRPRFHDRSSNRSVWGLLTSLYHAVAGPSQPNQAYTNFVNRCLQEKGYEVTGWQ